MKDTLTFKIRKEYNKLRKSEKRVADIVLSKDFDAINASIEKLSQLAGVSQPTIIRFANALGLKGFRELKNLLVAEKASNIEMSSFASVLTFPVCAEDKLVDTPAKVINTHTKHLSDMLKNLSSYELIKAVECIVNTKNIVIFAVENSTCVADDLKTKLTYMGFNVLFHSDPYLQKICSKNLSSDDVAIGISYSGFSKVTVDALFTAKNAGAKTISITNSANSMINKYADIILCTGNEQYLYGNAIFSRCTQIALIDMIYTGILTTNYEKYSQIIEGNTQEIKSFAYPNE